MTTFSQEDNFPLPWEIRIAYVKFTDAPGKGMVHSVLILELFPKFATCLQFTSKSDVSKYPKVEIPEWKELQFRIPKFLKLEPAYNVTYDNISPQKLSVAPNWLKSEVMKFYDNL